MDIKKKLSEIRKAWEGEKKEGEEGKKRLEIISRIIIACLIISLIVLIASVLTTDTKIIIATIACLIIFWAAMVYSIIFSVPDICLGLPSSIFSGRIKRNSDKDNFSVPVHKPYKEGLHIKLPWWTIKIVSRKVYTKNLVKREYPAKNGTVKVKGTVQYRPSGITLYRFLEFSEEDIDAAMDSEIENMIRCRLAKVNVEDAITQVDIVSRELWDRLAGHTITPKEAEEEDEKKNGKKTLTGHIKTLTRILFGENVTYSEHSYGVETLKTKVDTIDPSDDIKEARDSQQKEKYIMNQKKIQWDYLMERAKELGIALNDLNDEQILDAIQLWEGQSTKHTNKVELRDIEVLANIATALLKGIKK